MSNIVSSTRYLFTEYIALSHAKVVPQSNTELSPVYYVSYHGVLKKHITTTKLRIVFNGSSQILSGFSLNDLLHTGATLQMDITDILL